MSSEKRDAETAFSPEKVYQRLGEFVVVFQWFEDKILDILTRLDASDRFWDARPKFARKRFVEKLDLASELGRLRIEGLVAKAAAGALDGEIGRAAERWLPTFEETMDRCRALNTKRNTLVHSSYVHLESCNEVLGIVRSKLGRGPQAPVDDGDALQDLESALADAAPLAWDVATVQVQIVHWQGHWPPPK